MAGSSCQPGSWRLSYAHPAGSNVAHNSPTRPAPAGLSFQGQIRDVRKTLVFGTGRGLYGNHIFSVYPVSLAPPRAVLSPGRSKSLIAAAPCGKIRNCQSGGHPALLAQWVELATSPPCEHTRLALTLNLLKLRPAPGAFLFRGKSGMYGNPWFSVQAVACTEIISFPSFNRELDVKLSVRRCRVQGSFRGRDVPAT